MVLSQQTAAQIKEVLRKNPQGLSITEIVREWPINRNTAGRHSKKCLSPDKWRCAISVWPRFMHSPIVYRYLLSFPSRLTHPAPDNSTRIVFINDAFAHFLATPVNELMGKNIEFTPLVTAFDDFFPEFLAPGESGTGRYRVAG